MRISKRIAGKLYTINEEVLKQMFTEYDTPLYLYNYDIIKNKYYDISKYFSMFDVFYSLKANPNLSICKLYSMFGACAEVSSIGELMTALKAGFKPNDIIFVGPSKNEKEISDAIRNDIYALVVDSAYELKLIDQLAVEADKNVNVLLRINTKQGMADLQEVMAGISSKFGFDEERVEDQVSRLRLIRVNIIGIHVYAASQVLDSTYLLNHFKYVLALSKRISRNLEFNLKCIDFGGGFGIPYGKNDQELDLESISTEVNVLIEQNRQYLRNCRLIIELGRILIAESAIFITKVCRLKESRGKKYIIVDGGINQFLRPAFMRVNHHIELLSQKTKRGLNIYDICGPTCTPLDVLANDAKLPILENGDVIGIFDVGAYGYTMSILNFLSFDWPLEVLIHNRKFCVIRDRLKASELFYKQNNFHEIENVIK